MATEAYQPFLQRFLSITDGAPSMVHADLEPSGDALKALSAPVTEVATFYFDGEPSQSYASGLTKFREVIEKGNIEGFLGGAAGVTYEEVEREGSKGKAAILVVGWNSIESHMKFRETETFKENVGLLRDGIKGAEMHHVQFLNFAAAQV